jgi:RES domain
MKFKDLNPPIIELPSPSTFYRIQLIRSRATSLQVNGLSMPPVGLMHGRFCLPHEPVAYLADSQETALYESLLRRETMGRSLSEIRRKCLVEFVTTGPLRLADLRGLAEPYPVLQSLRVAQTQELAVDCRDNALDGLAYASAQHPHHTCIALFQPGIARLSKRGSQRLVKQGTNRLLQVLQVALWHSGVPLDDS